LKDGLSLEQIGVIVDRHPSTVSYWLKRYDLVPNGHGKHAPRGGLTREQLAPLVEAGATLQEIAGRLDRSITTVRYWIRRHGLPKPQRARRADVDRALREGRRTLTRRCGRHGETTFVIENGGRVRCRQCRMDRVSEQRRRNKARLVAENGGRCQLCGYDRCLAALEFHHVDRKAKSFTVSLRGVTKSIAALRAEAAKCALLCANCHAEVEVGYSRL
jgi:transposase